MLVVTPALGDDIAAKKQQVDSQIATLHDALAAQQQREAALRSQIDGVSSRIQALEAQVGDVSLRLSSFQEDLHLRQRLVGIYESPDVSTLDVVLGSTSIQEALDKANNLTRIGEQDRIVAAEVARSKQAMKQARAKTDALRHKIDGEARALAARASQQGEARAALLGATSSLNSAKQQKLVALSDLGAKERAEAGEIDALQQSSTALAAQIRAAQAGAGGSPATPSAAGLIWPVSGPVTSPFGWRWGRLHQGIDIGVATGTPIEAAAAGKVIYCGWETGYGNLVVLDNGGDLATAYAHQSAIAVTCGEDVNQGQVIGFVGCTGYCTGPHLHFEVRINGNPVDPLVYL